MRLGDLVSVRPSGAIVLGGVVSCDGFSYGCPVRVQSHVHLDHMSHFDTSKGFQYIVMSRPSLELLVEDLDADLPYRENVRGVAYGESVVGDGWQVVLRSSGHMLGAAQVEVALPDGIRLGYSGDFSWPIAETIGVDALVVDATYGSPRRRRQYSQADAELRLVELLDTISQRGAVHLKAHRGTLQRALQVLGEGLRLPLVASHSLCRELEVYRRFGVAIPPILVTPSEEAQRALQEGRFIRLYSRGDRWPVDCSGGSSVVLSAQMSSMMDPVIEYSDRSFCVALSDHADFDGTLEYVAATGASFVVTDNTRGHGVELAQELSRRLGVIAQAQPLEPSATLDWGL